MNEVLTIEEIRSRSDGEWVLIGDPVTDEQLGVISGRVLFHGKDRNEMYRHALRTRPGRVASLYLVQRQGLTLGSRG